MNPLPLTDPSGVVRAYACGYCGMPGDPCGMGHVPIGAEGHEEWRAARAEASRFDAEHCCRCDCGAPEAIGRTCPACRVREATAREAWLTRDANGVVCTRCRGQGYLWTDDDEDDPRCPEGCVARSPSTIVIGAPKEQDPGFAVVLPAVNDPGFAHVLPPVRDPGFGIPPKE